MFTADLKSFSTYGLPSPSPSHSPIGTPKKGRPSAKAETNMRIPSISTGSSPLKRKASSEIKPEPSPGTSDLYADPEVEFMSLVDRVKKRRQNP
ncbi:hypothetical protein HYPSUDRAFT_35327 [Hypholoma sublateritium FD-334 SS-4]|uniref:Uncharacterized protein n=1 Tax=Hypholoma sublateritium (strain FD-334 SS-4) TaxID=945553 RepID=A0A0D2MTV2_HYPSF|nr:hypothetical protein HYPSUDRAFT_35327 [Hypholoma sublateritium FD-334 SS-4]